MRKLMTTGALILPLLCGATVPAHAEDKCTEIQDLKKSGVIKNIRAEGKEIDVSKMWYGLKHVTRVDIAAAMLQCLNPSGKRIDIYDASSKEKIADYATLPGLTTY